MEKFLIMSESALMFMFGILILAIVSTSIVFRSPSSATSYFSTEKGKKALKGIVFFAIFGILMAFLFGFNQVKADEPTGKWLAYGEVFLGVDYTVKDSPQCFIADGPNSHATSNGGIRVNIFQSADKRFEFNSKYTHHSCAFNSDRELYDAVGVELSYRLW